MNHFPVPVLVVSKCLGFAACRYDGNIVADEFVDRLRCHVRVITVCPEMEIGLGLPRHKIRLVGHGSEQRLVQPATGRDLTVVMRRFANTFLEGLADGDRGARDSVDGFVLKSRSPSCGIRDTKIFDNRETETSSSRSSGLFARAVVETFSGHAIEDEIRLADPPVRREFLTKLFARAWERGVKGTTEPVFPEELMG